MPEPSEADIQIAETAVQMECAEVLRGFPSCQSSLAYMWEALALCAAMDDGPPTALRVLSALRNASDLIDGDNDAKEARFLAGVVFGAALRASIDADDDFEIPTELPPGEEGT